MTKKQIETLKLVLKVAVEAETIRNETGRVQKAIKEISDYLDMSFEMHIIEDYDKVSKIRTEIMNAGIEEHKRLIQSKAS